MMEITPQTVVLAVVLVAAGALLSYVFLRSMYPNDPSKDQFLRVMDAIVVALSKIAKVGVELTRANAEIVGNWMYSNVPVIRDNLSRAEWMAMWLWISRREKDAAEGEIGLFSSPTAWSWPDSLELMLAETFSKSTKDAVPKS